MSSPRWVSMLVAELYYPDSYFPNKGQQWPSRRPVSTEKPPPVYDFQNYQQYLQKRAGEGEPRIISANLQPTLVDRNEPANNATATPKPEQATNSQSSDSSYCDGVDELGCYQVIIFIIYRLQN